MCSERGKKGTEFIKTEKGGFQRDYTSCFERAVIGAGKQTYNMLYMINCLCLLLGERFIS